MHISIYLFCQQFLEDLTFPGEKEKFSPANIPDPDTDPDTDPRLLLFHQDMTFVVWEIKTKLSCIREEIEKESPSKSRIVKLAKVIKEIQEDIGQDDHPDMPSSSAFITALDSAMKFKQNKQWRKTQLFDAKLVQQYQQQQRQVIQQQQQEKQETQTQTQGQMQQPQTQTQIKPVKQDIVRTNSTGDNPLQATQQPTEQPTASTQQPTAQPAAETHTPTTAYEKEVIALVRNPEELHSVVEGLVSDPY